MITLDDVSQDAETTPEKEWFFEALPLKTILPKTFDVINDLTYTASFTVIAEFHRNTASAPVSPTLNNLQTHTYSPHY